MIFSISIVLVYSTFNLNGLANIVWNTLQKNMNFLLIRIWVNVLVDFKCKSGCLYLESSLHHTKNSTQYP